MFAGDYLFACMWEPHLSGEPEGSIDTTIMTVYTSICACVCVCEADIVGGISLSHAGALKIYGPYQSFIS